MYPYQHDAERRMTELVWRHGDTETRGRGDKGTRLAASPRPSLPVSQRLLNQLARELLLAESSDWAFQIYQGTTVEYSSRRFQSHIHRFDLLAKMLESGEVDHELLAEIERRDNIFAEIDYRAYSKL
jgi:1,4-alpha-glucan branching enzyme